MKANTRLGMEQNVAELRAQLEAAEAALEARKALPEDKELATEFHAMLCRWNHTDGCSWGYFPDGWESDHAHKDYLARAREVLKHTDAITALNVVKAATTWNQAR